MFSLHCYSFSRLRYLLALIFILPLVACSGGGSGGVSGAPASDSSLKAAELNWVAPSEREDGTGLSPSEIASFRIYYGASPGDYSNIIDVDDHTATQAVLAGLPSGTYFVVVTTVDTEGRESAFSPAVEVVL